MNYRPGLKHRVTEALRGSRGSPWLRGESFFMTCNCSESARTRFGPNPNPGRPSDPSHPPCVAQASRLHPTWASRPRRQPHRPIRHPRPSPGSPRDCPSLRPQPITRCDTRFRNFGPPMNTDKRRSLQLRTGLRKELPYLRLSALIGGQIASVWAARRRQTPTAGRLRQDGFALRAALRLP